MEVTIRIAVDGVWAGDGRWVPGKAIWDCPAVLAADPAANDRIYDAIEEALEGHPRREEIRVGDAVQVEGNGHRYEAVVIGIRHKERR